MCHPRWHCRPPLEFEMLLCQVLQRYVLQNWAHTCSTSVSRAQLDGDVAAALEAAVTAPATPAALTPMVVSHGHEISHRMKSPLTQDDVGWGIEAAQLRRVLSRCSRAQLACVEDATRCARC